VDIAYIEGEGERVNMGNTRVRVRVKRIMGAMAE
jgi:hypothetical protein